MIVQIPAACRKHVFMVFVLLMFLSAMPCIASAEGMTISDLSKRSFSGQFQKDISLLRSYEENIQKTVTQMEEGGLLQKDRKKDFDITEKRSLYLLWGNSLDYLVAFDSIIDRYRTFYLITHRSSHEDAFLAAYTGLLIRYAGGLRIIRQTIDNDLYEKMLDDTNIHYGIPSGMYARLKWNTIHLQEMTGVFAGYRYCQLLKKSYKKRGLMTDEKTAWMFDSIERNYNFITREMKQSGPQYFAANGLDILKDQGFKAWFPLQMQVSEWLGDTKVKRLNSTLISAEQLRVMKKQLQPGDIIVERRNWYLSNVGLPGFWPHAELFIGGYNDMKTFFSDASVVNHYRKKGNYKDFMDYLTRKYPLQMKEFRNAAPDGHPYQIIEAVSEGVKFSSLEEGTLADYIGVVRPRLSKLDIARAVDEAFYYLGRPYDFNFDFLTDSSIVCSELIYKVYKGGQGSKGIGLSLREIAGRKAMPANDIVAKFDREYDSPDRELDFVYFLDGLEKDKKAVSRGLSDFRSSHQRMKWDIAQK